MPLLYSKYQYCNCKQDYVEINIVKYFWSYLCHLLDDLCDEKCFYHRLTFFTSLDKRKCFVVHQCLHHKKKFLLHCSLLYMALPNCLDQCKPRKGKRTILDVNSTLG